MTPADGLIVVNKEAGWTSFDVVAKLRRILGTRKVGHTGTLDPMATGVLPVVYGRGTRLAELLSEHDKTYRCTCHLGISTDTQDMTGEVLASCEVKVSEEELREALMSFQGEYDQVPPMYSALKVGGRRLYELAREGVSVEREARRVTLTDIRLLSYESPLAVFEVSCSKGTYIRTLCHDLGEKLGCGAAMESLTRSRSGDFSLEQAHTIAEIEGKAQEGGLGEWILGLDDLLSCYPRIVLRPEDDRLLANGNRIPGGGYPMALDPEEGREDGLVRMCLSTGELMGLYAYRVRDGVYLPVKMLLQG